MLLTIAIPTYNRAQNVYSTINSFAIQIEQHSLREVEVVISDNCSTDNTRDICANLATIYPNIQIKYFRNNLNIGFDGNVNALFHHASGKYVWTFSDDDQLTPDALLHVVSLLKQRDVRFAFVNYKVNIENQILPSRFGSSQDCWLEAKQLLKYIKFSNSLISSCIFLNDAWLSSNPEKFIGSLWIHFFVAREILQTGEGLVIGQPAFSMMQSNLQTSRAEKRMENSNAIEFYMMAHLKFVAFASQLKNYNFDQETIEVAHSLGRSEDIHQVINFKLSTPHYSFCQIFKTWQQMAHFRKNDIQFWLIVTPLIWSPSWIVKTARSTYRYIKSCN